VSLVDKFRWTIGFAKQQMGVGNQGIPRQQRGAERHVRAFIAVGEEGCVILIVLATDIVHTVANQITVDNVIMNQHGRVNHFVGRRRGEYIVQRTCGIISLIGCQKHIRAEALSTRKNEFFNRLPPTKIRFTYP
jgi:hypothetical protein